MTPCTQTQQALYDIYLWKQKFAQPNSKVSGLVGTVCYSKESTIPNPSTPDCSGINTDPILIKLTWTPAESAAESYLILQAPSTTSLAMLPASESGGGNIIDIIQNIVIPAPNSGSCTSSGCNATIITNNSGCPSGQTCDNSVIMDGGCSGANCNGSLIMDNGCTAAGQSCQDAVMVGSCGTNNASVDCSGSVLGGSCSGAATCVGAVIAGDCSGNCTNATVFGNCNAGAICTGATVYGTCRAGSIDCVKTVANSTTDPLVYDSKNGLITGISVTYFGLTFTAIDINKCTNKETCNNTMVGAACSTSCNSSFIDGACNNKASCVGSVVNGNCSGTCDSAVIMGNCQNGASCKDSVVYGTCANNANCTGATCKNSTTGAIQPC